MKKEIKVVDSEKGIVRVTTSDERWYAIPSNNPETGLPDYRYIPSVTWIAGHYPKGIAFYKWLADKGWDESQALKQAAGDKGSKVHQALELLISGGEVRIDDHFTNSSGSDEELSTEEWDAILSFVSWNNEYHPKFLMTEQTVISEKYGFAGTVDVVAQIGEQVYIIDFKTGQYIWPEYELQVSAYRQALSEMGRKTDTAKLAILQLGYKKNKKRFKFTEVDDKFPLFQAAMRIWENECSGQSVSQKEYPISVKLPAEKTEKKVKSKKLMK